MSKYSNLILYVGGFKLPDGNAAAQRVMANAAALNELGYEVVFLNANPKCDEMVKTTYLGFECYDIPKKGILTELFSFKPVKKILKKRDFFSVIAYNYPAFLLLRLISYCRKKNIRCYADATEWYQPKGKFLYRIVKKIDTEWRMRWLHFRMNGVIAISEYLYQYYQARVNTVKIPPLVNLSQKKWESLEEKKIEDGCTDFVYCGNPSAQKECLNQIVDVVEALDDSYLVRLTIIGITLEEYEKMYGVCFDGKRTSFLGRISHEDSLRYISQSDWSVIIREDNKVVKAGFPTKLVESISCGTPVVINSFSNIGDYVDNKNGIITIFESIEDAILLAISSKKNIDKLQFDYHNYLGEFSYLLNCHQ